MWHIQLRAVPFQFLHHRQRHPQRNGLITLESVVILPMQGELQTFRRHFNPNLPLCMFQAVLHLSSTSLSHRERFNMSEVPVGFGDTFSARLNASLALLRARELDT